MTCPRCKKDHDILQYIRLETSPEFELETTPVYKCPTCKWLFAPAGEMSHDVYSKLQKELQDFLKSIVAERDKSECQCQT
jgi:rubredoxin